MIPSCLSSTPQTVFHFIGILIATPAETAAWRVKALHVAEIWLLQSTIMCMRDRESVPLRAFTKLSVSICQKSSFSSSNLPLTRFFNQALLIILQHQHSYLARTSH